MAYILVVDDDEDFAQAAAGALRGEGHEVGIQLEASDALEVMEGHRPDLVVLDVMFPEDSSAGFTLARKIRHYSETLRGVPVLMLTAINAKFPLGFSRRDVDDTWLPVSDFLEKPVDLSELCSKVSQLLRETGASSEPAEDQATE